MRARTRRLPCALAALALLAGLAVEGWTAHASGDAARALPSRARSVLRTLEADRATAAALETAYRHAAAGRAGECARALESVLATEPSAPLHALASLAWLATGDGVTSARHAQLAARLAPEDAALSSGAERALDLAVVYRARGATRTAGALGSAFLLVLLAAGWHGRRARRHRDAFLDALAARVRVTVDGEDVTAAPILEADSESLLLDVFLHGRYGMACPRRRGRDLALHVTFSHAGSSRTVRLTPVREVRESAVRVPVRAETLRRLLAEEGRWIVHVRLGTRALLALPLDVRARRVQRGWARPHALHA
jgi:hypothetical protein